MLDWELSKKALVKRMEGWVDKTLISRLKNLGYTHYSPKFETLIRAGKYKIPEKTRKRLERKYGRMAAQHAKQLKKTAPVNNIPILTGTWHTLEEWLKRRSRNRPEFNIDLSRIKLENRDFHFVWTRGSLTIFTNKKTKGDMTGPVPNQGFYGVYEVGIYTTGVRTYADGFMQASHTLVYGPDPTKPKILEEVKAEIGVFEKRNADVINNMNRAQLAYRWNDETHEGEITFVGLGVKL